MDIQTLEEIKAYEKELKRQGLKWCADCRDGEHDNYTDSVAMTVLKDPETGKLVKRCYMCSDHFEMYAEDGYKIIRHSTIDLNQ